MTESGFNIQLSLEKHPTSVNIPKISSYRHSLPEYHVQNKHVSMNLA